MKTKIAIMMLSVVLVVSLMLIGCAPEERESEVYPSKPIILIVPFSPGGGSDTMARHIAINGEQHFGQPIAVLTKTGAAGGIALAHLLKQQPDGYHMMCVTLTHVLTLATGAVPYDCYDFQYVIRIQGEPYGMLAAKDAPFDNIEEYIDYARAHPGEVTVGGAPMGSIDSVLHLLLVEAAGGLEVQYVPYDGTGDVMTALLGQHVMAGMGHPTKAQAHVETGNMKALGWASEERAMLMPDVPTYREQGYDILLQQVRGVITHGDVPMEVVQQMHDFLKKTIHEPDFVEFQEKLGLEFMDTLAGSAEYMEWCCDSVDQYKDILKKAGVL